MVWPVFPISLKALNVVSTQEAIEEHSIAEDVFLPFPFAQVFMLIGAAAPQRDFVTPFSEGQELEKEGDDLSQEKNFAEAAVKYDGAARKFAEAGVLQARAEAYYKKAKSLERDRKINESEKAYAEAASAFARSFEEMRVRKAVIYIRDEQKLEHAFKMSGQNRSPLVQKVHTILGLVYLDRGANAKALAAIDRALQIATWLEDYPEIASLQGLRADALLASNRHYEAMEGYFAAIKAHGVVDNAKAQENATSLWRAVSKLARARNLSMLSVGGMATFKSLLLEIPAFGDMPPAQQVEVATNIYSEWRKTHTNFRCDELIPRQFLVENLPSSIEADILLLEGEGLVEERNYQEAVQKFREAAEKFRLATNFDGEIRARAEEIGALREGNAPEDVINEALFSEARALASAAEYVDGIERAVFLEKRVASLIFAGEIDRAMQSMQQVEDLYRRASELGAIVEMHENFGNVFVEVDMDYLAAIEYGRAAEVNSELGRFVNAARLFGKMGDVLAEMGAYNEQALAAYDRAATEAGKVRDMRLTRAYIYKKAEVLITMDKLVDAAREYDGLAQRSRNPDNIRDATTQRQAILSRVLGEARLGQTTDTKYLDDVWTVWKSIGEADSSFLQLSQREQWGVADSILTLGKSLSPRQLSAAGGLYRFARERYLAAKAAGAEASGMRLDGRGDIGREEGKRDSKPFEPKVTPP